MHQSLLAIIYPQTNLPRLCAPISFQEWIGKQFGTRAIAKNSAKWIYLLAPTPELWTLVLRHRTQILYLADIAMVCFQLELRPGSIVLESGTGSGSLTTSLARAVAPSGHVHTFEFHAQRAEAACDDFRRNGLVEVVTVEHRNVEENGFPESLHDRADAVFLDLPEPWKAVPSAVTCLRPDGVFCGFSPCVEQVQRTCQALNATGMRDLHTIEILLREYEVTQERRPMGLEGLTETLREHIKLNKNDAGLKMKEGHKSSKKPRMQGGLVVEEKQQQAGEEREMAVMEVEVDNNHNPGEVESREGEGMGPHGHKVEEDKMNINIDEGNDSYLEDGGSLLPVPLSRQSRGVIARPVAQGRGHTGFLTFARKAVDVVPV